MLLRSIVLVVLMSALLLLYRIHPFVGWATLSLLFAGTLVRRKRTRVVVEE